MSCNPNRDRPEDWIVCFCGEEGRFEDLFARGALASHCHGTGELRCYCGGDFCVCHYHGSTECPGCPDCERDELDDEALDYYDPYDFLGDN